MMSSTDSSTGKFRVDGQLGGGTGLEEGRWVDEVIKGMPLKDIFFLELSVLPLLPGH